MEAPRTGWSERAAAAVAGFTSTRSKVPDAVHGAPGGPTHLASASGATVETADGRMLLDWTMALGSVALGYAHPEVTRAVERAARDGVVGPLAPTLEVEVAERLAAAYPGAERARFFKTGAEAVAAAVRLARLLTGRDAVVHCGYHGWLDGPVGGPGVPSAAAELWVEVPFDDRAALEARARGLKPAAIVLEPVVERAPSRGWLEGARAVADETGAVLVFDEIKTAFRLARGGAAERWDVRPDLAVLGKALANGLPLAALVGRADVMAGVASTWISSTLATESVSLAAAAAVMDVWDREDVAGHIERTGALMLRNLEQACGRAGAEVLGLPAMWLLRFGDARRERRFVDSVMRRGVLLKRGAYNFPSLAHADAEVDRTLEAVRAALEESA